MDMRQGHIQHLKRNLELFREVTGRETVEEYIQEYDKKYPGDELYERLCLDMEIEPVEIKS